MQILTDKKTLPWFLPELPRWMMQYITVPSNMVTEKSKARSAGLGAGAAGGGGGGAGGGAGGDAAGGG